MLFKVLAGRHVQDGITYSKGDVVETNMNLVEMFSDLKFKREFELESKDVKKTPAQPPKKKKVVKEKDEDTTDDVDDEDEEDEDDEEIEPLGDDLTVRFSVATANGFLVFKKNNKFMVAAEGKPDEALNKKPLKRSEVVKFIESIKKKD